MAESFAKIYLLYSTPKTGAFIDEQSKPMWRLSITLIYLSSSWISDIVHQQVTGFGMELETPVKSYEESSTGKLGLWILTGSRFAKKKKE